jgi:HSP20 family protein
VADNVHLLYQEYVPGDCHRCFRIREDVDVDAIKAKMSNGVLTVTLPKARHVRKKRIEVK